MQPKEGRLVQHLEDRRYHRRAVPVQHLDVPVASQPATNTSPHCTVSATYRSLRFPRYDECSGRPVPLGAAARSAAQHEAHRIRGQVPVACLSEEVPIAFDCVHAVEAASDRFWRLTWRCEQTRQPQAGGGPAGVALGSVRTCSPASSDRKWNSHVGRAYRAMYPPRRKHARRSARRTAGLAATCIAATPTVRALAESSEYYRYRTLSPLVNLQAVGRGASCQRWCCYYRARCLARFVVVVDRPKRA
jgi:hypothetical protein